jgi:hypothetical protein
MPFDEDCRFVTSDFPSDSELEDDFRQRILEEEVTGSTMEERIFSRVKRFTVYSSDTEEPPFGNFPCPL